MRSIALAALVAVSALAQAAEPVQEQTLANGLKVLVKEDHRAPIVTSQVWYKVGSSYEHGGMTGISHALEHMMFKGTPAHGPGEFSAIIAANGGDENAFTSRDYTAYFQNLSADRLAVAFDLEADRMRNLSLNAKEFAKEIQVVMEERRMRTDDNPIALTDEKFTATAYESSPYRIPTIGWMSDLKAMNVGELHTWYRKWYAPNNATLVVVGDVQPKRVFALAEKYFGPLKAEPTARVRPSAEAVQDGTKRVVVKAPAQQPYLVMGFKATNVAAAAKPWEPYALEMLAEILSGGSSSRLDRDLVRGNEMAASADADYSAFTRLPGMLTLDAVPAKSHSIAEVEQALRKEVARLRDQPVSAAELERVRNRVIASKVYRQDSVFYQAMRIGMLESIGLDGRLADEYTDKINAVTAAQVQAVARKYLTDDNLTVAVLDPQPLKGRRPHAALSGGSHDIR